MKLEFVALKDELSRVKRALAAKEQEIQDLVNVRGQTHVDLVAVSDNLEAVSCELDDVHTAKAMVQRDYALLKKNYDLLKQKISKFKGALKTRSDGKSDFLTFGYVTHSPGLFLCLDACYACM